MLEATETVIRELGLIAKALSLLSETVQSERARGALMFSVETLGQIEQQVVDLDFLIRSRTIALESCRLEVSRLREAPVDSEWHAARFRSSGLPSA